MVEDNINDIIKDYESKFVVFEKFTQDVRNLVEKLLLANQIKFDHIEARTKSIASFSEKISRDGKDYANPLTDITDISGIRVVVYSLTEIESVADIINSNFVVDLDKSIDKSKKMRINEFGYLSKHLIVSFKEERLVLPENCNYRGLKAEIQIRTVLQHAWAAIEHKINYKHTVELPDEQRRDFYRLSAVLELADKEFQCAIESYEKTKAEYEKEINGNNIDTIELNSDSIKYFLDSTDFKEKENKYNSIDRLLVSFDMDDYPSRQFFSLLRLAQITSLEQLSELLGKEEFIDTIKSIVDIWKQDKQDSNLKLVLSRLTLIRLLVYFSSDKSKKDEILKKELLSSGMINLIKQLPVYDKE